MLLILVERTANYSRNCRLFCSFGLHKPIFDLKTFSTQFQSQNIYCQQNNYFTFKSNVFKLNEKLKDYRVR
jgi:hypothetical protein